MVSITWDKFKAFLQKSLSKTTFFVDSIWNKIKKDSEYQLKKVQDWAAYLEYLQLIFIEFYPVFALTEDHLGWDFYEGLRLSIKR